MRESEGGRGRERERERERRENLPSNRFRKAKKIDVRGNLV